MKDNKEDFDKAVKNKIGGNIGGTLACGFLIFLFSVASYIFYTVEPISMETGLIFFMLGLVALVGLIYNLGEMLIIGTQKRGKIVEDYHLCKRCKCLINKDKVFCNDCKNELRRSLKHNKDKKYFKEYKAIVKKEKKK